MEWTTYYDPTRGWICTAIPAAKRQRTEDGSDSGSSDSKAAGKKGKGKGTGPCFECGGPHLARNCPNKKGEKGKGKGGKAVKGKGKIPWQYPYSKTEWRVFYPRPSPSVWSSWYPGARNKGKDGKGAGKAVPGKGTSFLKNVPFPPLGNVSNESSEETGWGIETTDWNSDQSYDGGWSSSTEEVSGHFVGTHWAKS